MSEPYYQDDSVRLYHGDCLDVLSALQPGSVDCCVTSPPYFGLRDYGIEGQHGREASPAEYIDNLVRVFREVRRVLADDGTLWLNLGDSYASKPSRGRGVTSAFAQRSVRLAQVEVGSRVQDYGIPQKGLLGIPWRVALALQDDGWILRNDIIWAKPNGMPESVTDRLSTKHEHLFLLAKSRRYWFDLAPIREPLAYPDAADGSRVFGGKNKADALQTGSSSRRMGATYGKAAGKSLAPTGRQHLTPDVHGGRNPGDVWTIPTVPFSEAHFAAMPPELARRAVLAGCKPGGTVLDPYSGSGTTGMVAAQTGRRFFGIDLSQDYLDLSLRTRLAQSAIPDFGEGA